MIHIQLDITGGGPRSLVYADVTATARTLVYDYAGVQLEPDGQATVAALNGRIRIGTWTAEPVTCEPDQVMVTWIGPDADHCDIVETKHLDTWIAARLEPLLATHPDLIGFTGDIGTWIDRHPTTTVRTALAGWAADNLATSLLDGNHHIIAHNFIACHHPDPTILDPVNPVDPDITGPNPDLAVSDPINPGLVDPGLVDPGLVDSGITGLIGDPTPPTLD
ncbi:MAG: hypothetical protein LBV06_07205 [Propionibacteriaceae bacterium]|jgi:hypothetical protein|nr:hypothetical protein [Propionibacteriaceae bacterium]